VEQKLLNWARADRRAIPRRSTSMKDHETDFRLQLLEDVLIELASFVVLSSFLTTVAFWVCIIGKRA
jgi:hypothetical protein